MSSEEDIAQARRQVPRLARLYRWHVVAYAVLIGGLTVVNIFVGGGWWAFWPTIVWGLVLALHFFYYKCITIDERWAEERTDDLRLRSYDLSHILDIQDRVEQHDASVRPGGDREKQS